MVRLKGKVSIGMSDKEKQEKRIRCEGCDRPPRTCLCSHLLPVEHETELLILRHSSETRHAINTAEIVVRMSRRCRLFDGEVFDKATSLRPGGHHLLLFPGEEAEPLVREEGESGPTQLILLDGTWRKARRILQANPWLALLPRVSVPTHPSRYILRKQKPEGSSTLEACVAALSILEPPEEHYHPMLEALDRMMHLQREAMGETRFQRDFGDR